MRDQNKDSGQETGQFREKLIRRKQEWAAEGRLLTGKAARPEAQRLPPGQREVKTWPVLDLGAQPRIDLALWRLTVDGVVENPVSPWIGRNSSTCPSRTPPATSIA
jgi:DMSO/TMAO reductase YedYZ molybdopterin-dependent catalytic subunit